MVNKIVRKKEYKKEREKNDDKEKKEYKERPINHAMFSCRLSHCADLRCETEILENLRKMGYQEVKLNFKKLIFDGKNKGIEFKSVSII